MTEDIVIISPQKSLLDQLFGNISHNESFAIAKIFAIFSPDSLSAKYHKKSQELLKSNISPICLVGGAVRNLLLKLPIKDFDFATPFTPEEIKEILKSANITCFDINKRFGTIIALVKGCNLQITTLRQELQNDGRFCDVEFISNYQQDSARRDFTINALYLNKDGKILDFHDGISDIKNKIVKFIGDAETRIAEDHLRILRFFRMQCYYGNEIYHKNSLDSAISNLHKLEKISQERIREEIYKILLSPVVARRNFIALASQNKIFEIIWQISLINYKRLSYFIDLLAQCELNLPETTDNSKSITKISTMAILQVALLLINREINLKIVKNSLINTKEEEKYLLKLQNIFIQQENFTIINKIIKENKINWQLLQNYIVKIIIHYSEIYLDAIILLVADFITKNQVPHNKTLANQALLNQNLVTIIDFAINIYNSINAISQLPNFKILVASGREFARERRFINQQEKLIKIVLINKILAQEKIILNQNSPWQIATSNKIENILTNFNRQIFLKFNLLLKQNTTKPNAPQQSN